MRGNIPKKRLDILLVEKGLVATIAKSKAMILAGEVYVDGQKLDKAGLLVDNSKEIEIRSRGSEFVSRGGKKLFHAISEFGLDVSEMICVDIGASTGGFTDCLLKNGAKKVYAIDVGYGQLDWKLRSDERVVVFEKTNIRNLDVDKIQEKIDLVVIDVSFIGLEKVFPKVAELVVRHCEPGGRSKPVPPLVIALIKPQFQVGKGKVEKGGVVRDEKLRQEAVEFVKVAAEDLGWKFKGITESPIKGPKGNTEYLALWTT